MKEVYGARRTLLSIQVALRKELRKLKKQNLDAI